MLPMPALEAPKSPPVEAVAPAFRREIVIVRPGLSYIRYEPVMAPANDEARPT